MKNIVPALCVLGSMLAGWHVMPALYFTPSRTCDARTLYITQGENRKTVTESSWLFTDGLSHILYSSRIRIYGDGRLLSSVPSERIIDLKTDVHTRSVEMTNPGPFVISGPEDADSVSGPYLDPLAKAGFSSNIYFFRAGSATILGFKDRPRLVCQPGQSEN
ncbi:hypothetical protein [Enterobacter bugandensis]|uniref:hypothetical protein n=1 Tax=Enterobacter bugandensis TaxID=881260 RepID=UPI0013D242B6|nr:hypothetical protein [Enterobacter bugandensis]